MSAGSESKFINWHLYHRYPHTTLIKKKKEKEKGARLGEREKGGWEGKGERSEEISSSTDDRVTGN